MRLHVLSPDPAIDVADHQAKQKMLYDCHSKSRELFVGQRVMICDFLLSTKWVEGTVSKCLGPVTYLIDFPHGIHWKGHIDHIRAREGGKEGASLDPF